MTEDLVAQWRAMHERTVEGWDFSELEDRIESTESPWSYAALARRVLAGSSHVLDMGTGGGEVLGSLADELPRDTVATEGWPPNVPVARRNLSSFGIHVVPYDAESDPALPFPDDRFDVVLNRHEAYTASEVARVLTAGGRFLTQQVDGRDFAETQAIFGGSTAYPHVTLAHFRREAEAAGLIVEAADEWSGTVRFSDVATLVRYFAFVPWEVPGDFAVDSYAQQLLDLHASGRELAFTRRRFFLLCRR